MKEQSIIPFLMWQATCSVCGHKGDANTFPVLLAKPICKNCYDKQKQAGITQRFK